jgi:hypothetical protein
LPGDDILFTYLNMNSKQAKAEPLPEFLGRLGHEPTSIRGHDVWYRSPFRPDERTPSFKVDRQKNVWYDHGIGAGGTIIDLMVQLEGQADISRVLERIANVLGSPARPLVLPSVVDRPKATPEIESVSAISDRALEAYVVSRGIPLDLARLHLKEVAYRVGEHGYRALGFANDAGGFEVRNAHFKGSLGTKDIRFLEQVGSNRAAVFEGFFDFLSVLAHYKRERAESNVLVLNSMALLDRGMERLAAKPIQKIYGYLDHDSAGEKGLATLQGRGLWEVVDASRLYDGFKDANAFWA